MSGALVEQTYASGRVVKNVLDNDGELSIVQSKKNASSGFWNYASHFTRTAAGAVSSMQLGNGRWESTVFNERLQPTQIALGTIQNGTDKLKLNFTYHTTGQNNNNGNVLSQTITVPTVGGTPGFTATQNYVYDSLNRLSQAGELFTPHGGTQTSSWTQTFTYDRYGNRRFNTDHPSYTTTIPAGSLPKVVNPEILPSNNKFKADQDGDLVNDYLYDAAGNTTRDALGKQFTYDAENKQKEVKNINNVSLGTYFYDGDGKRVKKIAGSEVTIFVYDAAGKLVAEYANEIIAPSAAKVSYLTSDHLGSPRINTDASGTIIARHDYLPFGEEISSAQTAQRSTNLHYGADDVRQKFTGYERDNESSLDFAQARMYGYNHGRFTSPDPYKIVAEVQLEKDEEKARAKLNRYLSQPQQWNHYVYAINNPLKYTDPTGEIVVLKGETEEDRKAELERIKNIIGEKAFSYLSVSTDTRFVFVTEVNQHGFASALNNTEHERDISKIMGKILSSSEVVEFKITRTFTYKKNGNELRTEDIRADRAGAVTVPANESLTGNIQIFVHPLASDVANQKAPFGKPELSSDGERLKFENNSIVDGHEFGHGYDLLTGQEGNWRTLENALREKHKVTQRRAKH